VEVLWRRETLEGDLRSKTLMMGRLRGRTLLVSVRKMVHWFGVSVVHQGGKKGGKDMQEGERDVGWMSRTERKIFCYRPALPL
jgi:hypothetical protein